MKERGNSLLRFLDRYAGIPLVFTLKLFKWKKRNLPPNLRSIALLKTAGIGDTVLLSAIVSDLQNAFPDVKITIFTGRLNREMGKLIPGCEVVALPMTSPLKSIQIVREHQFDFWIDCSPWPRIDALLSFFSRSACTVGFKTPGQCRHWLYDKKIDHSLERHEVDNYRALIKDLGVQGNNKPDIKLEEVISNKKRVALHLFPGGSRAYLKMWPDDKWLQQIDYLKKNEYEILFTGGKQDYVRVEELLGSKGRERILNWAGKLSLKESALALKTCACLISVDTGIMHLAAALGCHVISLHGPTSPNRWGAVGEKVTAITPNLDYTPCIHFGYESICKKNHCMQMITVEQVIQTLEGILDESIHFSGGKRDKTLALVTH